MSLRDEIKPFLTKGGYVGNSLVSPDTIRSCDNHPMFTSEYYILLSLNGELVEQDRRDYARLINDCVDTELRRFPGDHGSDQIDDYIGVLSARKALGLTSDIRVPIPIRLWRFPQLIFMSHAHTYQWWNFWLWPFLFYTYGSIYLSCRKDALSDLDARRLAWLMIQCVDGCSWVLSGVIHGWYDRLTNDYGQTGMKMVARMYYRDNHPFQRYWRNS